ncbi:hypothetical protein FB451DRAFT_1549078 [Mycena latifolia]|nr:hypothetical protein FB451DRAFT_1549078 [Mycena latifolia]
MPPASFTWATLKAETLRSVCKDLHGAPRAREGMIEFLDALDSANPWKSMRAKTLQSVCKDLGAVQVSHGKRDAMVVFLSDAANQGASLSKKGSMASPKKASAASATSGKSVATGKVPRNDPVNNMDVDADADSNSSGDVETMLGGDVEPTCGCKDGWLSPRQKFILETTAEVAQDLIRDTGEFAGEYGHVSDTVYLVQYLPPHATPRGKKAAALWVDGFVMMFEVIAGMLKAGKVPTADKLEQTLDRDKKRAKLWKAYAKNGANCEHALEALVRGAKCDWEEGDFKDAFCEEEEWRKLPVCKEHDLNWSAAEDGLVG